MPVIPSDLCFPWHGSMVRRERAMKRERAFHVAARAGYVTAPAFHVAKPAGYEAERAFHVPVKAFYVPASGRT